MKMKSLNDPEFMEEYRQRVETLAGEDGWCPYPNDWFANVIMHADDNKALELINERRVYLFPQFLSGDPQANVIESLVQKYELTA